MGSTNELCASVANISNYSSTPNSTIINYPLFPLITLDLSNILAFTCTIPASSTSIRLKTKMFSWLYNFFFQVNIKASRKAYKAPSPPDSRGDSLERDRSLTVMIPRAKYRPAPPPLLTMSTFTPQQKLINYLNQPDKVSWEEPIL